MEHALKHHGLEIAGRGVFGGSSFWMRAPRGVDTDVLAAKLRDKDVLIEPGRPFFGGETPPKRFYRLAYSSIPLAKIPEGVARTSDQIQQLMRRNGSIV